MALPKVDAQTLANIESLRIAAEAAVLAYNQAVNAARQAAGVQPLTPLAKDGTWITPDSIYR